MISIFFKYFFDISKSFQIISIFSSSSKLQNHQDKTSARASRFLQKSKSLFCKNNISI
jgi:hypothetical protein